MHKTPIVLRSENMSDNYGIIISFTKLISSVNMKFVLFPSCLALRFEPFVNKKPSFLKTLVFLLTLKEGN